MKIKEDSLALICFCYSFFMKDIIFPMKNKNNQHFLTENACNLFPNISVTKYF